MSSEDSLWETLEEAIRDGYFIPFQLSGKDDEALFPLVARMNTLMLLMGDRMRSALDILRERELTGQANHPARPGKRRHPHPPQLWQLHRRTADFQRRRTDEQHHLAWPPFQWWTAEPL